MQKFLDMGNLLVAQKSLDALWLKQKIISDNLANIDTPGYKSRSVEFEDILQKTLAFSGGQGDGFTDKLDSLQPKIVQNDSTQMRLDGNNVDADEQNVELLRTQLQYELMSRMISEDISRIKYAIDGRG